MPAVVLPNGQLIVLSDFIFHFDDDSDREARQFMELIHSCGFEQHVQFPTDEKGHKLDLIITRESSRDVVSNLSVDSSLPSNHTLFTINTNYPKLVPPRIVKKNRNLSAIRDDSLVSSVRTKKTCFVG